MLAMSPVPGSPYARIQFPHNKSELMRQSQQIHDRSVADLEAQLKQHQALMQQATPAASMHIQQAMAWLSGNTNTSEPQ